MCGFVAVVTPAIHQTNLVTDDSRSQLQQTLMAMTNTLEHRGPDAKGQFISENEQVALGHTRLSIIDLENGQQPLTNSDFTLIYNGEIYNHLELRTELETLGHTFNSHCDTEVLLHAWQEWGEACIDKLNGMFAFVLYDHQRKKIDVVRDRLGIKPIYYTIVDDQTILVASELKALLAHPSANAELSATSIHDYFSLGYVPEPNSIYKNIYKLPAGHRFTIDLTAPVPSSGINLMEYWDCVALINNPERHTSSQQIKDGKVLLADAINKRTIADVPVGAFLSGGVDSSIIVSEMNKNNNVSTYSMGFDQQDYDESCQAETVAQHLKTQHVAMTVSCNTFDYLPELVQMFDEPFADNSAIPTYLLTKQAKKEVTVMLSGDGADELFLGYRNYRLLSLEKRIKKLIPSFIHKPVFSFLAKHYPAMPWAPRFLRAQSTLVALNNDLVTNFHQAMSINPPETLEQIFSEEFRQAVNGHSAKSYFQQYASKVTNDDVIKQAQYIDFKTYLPGNILTKVDRTTMANSIEARVPFMDHRLVEQWLAKSSEQNIKGAKSKLLLRKIAADILPSWITGRRKQSFTSPMDEWFRMMTLEELKKRMQLDILKSTNWFNIPAIEALINAHYSGKQNIGMTLWSIAVFAEFIKAQGRQTEQ